MAKITKEERRILTKAEALSLVKNADGKVRFQVFVRAWLPTTEGRGFEGSCCLGVSRTDMLTCIERCCSDVLAGRGAKVELNLRPAEGKYGHATITLW